MAASLELLQPALFLVGFLVIALLSLNFLATKNVKYPPVIKGWIPWLGCAIDFGKAPLHFIKNKKSSEKHGVIFTVYAAGERMTFLTDASDFHAFFNSPQADFQRAAQETVKNTAGINKVDFLACEQAPSWRQAQKIFGAKRRASGACTHLTEYPMSASKFWTQSGDW